MPVQGVQTHSCGVISSSRRSSVGAFIRVTVTVRVSVRHGQEEIV